jgi:hypothetical protein
MLGVLGQQGEGDHERKTMRGEGGRGGEEVTSVMTASRVDAMMVSIFLEIPLTPLRMLAWLSNPNICEQSNEHAFKASNIFHQT